MVFADGKLCYYQFEVPAPDLAKGEVFSELSMESR